MYFKFRRICCTWHRSADQAKAKACQQNFCPSSVHGAKTRIHENPVVSVRSQESIFLQTRTFVFITNQWVCKYHSQECSVPGWNLASPSFVFESLNENNPFLSWFIRIKFQSLFFQDHKKPCWEYIYSKLILETVWSIFKISISPKKKVSTCTEN